VLGRDIAHMREVSHRTRTRHKSGCEVENELPAPQRRQHTNTPPTNSKLTPLEYQDHSADFY
jgi:hypothetical protein